jgi:hypothetical protein
LQAASKDIPFEKSKARTPCEDVGEQELVELTCLGHEDFKIFTPKSSESAIMRSPTTTICDFRSNIKPECTLHFPKEI